MSDNQEATPPSVATPVQTWVRAPDYRSLFANHSRMRIGPGEIGLTFGHHDEAPGGVIILSDQIGITITPTHAKRLVILLSEFLNAYEERFGHIPAEPTTPIDVAKATEAVEKAMEAWNKSD